MTKVIVDTTLRSKLNGLNDHVELCDESGQSLGHFLPRELYAQWLNAVADVLFPKEELKAEQADTSGRPLAEIWKKLGRT